MVGVQQKVKLIAQFVKIRLQYIQAKQVNNYEQNESQEHI